MSLQYPMECLVCCKTFSGPMPAQQHYSSVEHKRRMAVKQTTTGCKCDVCNITCDTLEMLERHYQSPRHHAMAQKQQQFNFGRDSTPQMDASGGQNEAYKFSASTKRGYCYVCSIDLTSEAHAQSHISGKAHKKRAANSEVMKRMASPVNLSGNQSLSGVPSRDVYQTMAEGGTVHGAAAQILPNITQNTGAVFIPTSSSPLKCEICDVAFTGQVCAEQHFSSEKHKKKASQRVSGNGSTYSCSLCNVSFTGPENEEIHRLSQKHIKNVKLQEMKEKGEDLPLSCNACGCSFTGQETAASHFEGKKHKRNMVNMNIKYSSLEQTQPHPVRLTSSDVTENASVNEFAKPLKVRLDIQNDSRDSVLVKPVQQMRSDTSIRQSQDDSLIVKPIESDEENPSRYDNTRFAHRSDEDSLIIKPIEDGRCSPKLESLQDESKIRDETYTSISSLIGSSSINSGDISPTDTEPVRYIRNDLHSSLFSGGRGRGIFNIVRQEDSRLPGKVVNSDVATQNETTVRKIDLLDDHDERTVRKSVWEGTGAAPKIKREDYERYGHAESDRHIGEDITDIVYENNFSAVNDLDSPVSTYNVNPPREEYSFDEITGRGMCYVCDVNFTSSKHKTQHISGRNHLKACEIRKQMMKGSEFASSEMVCKICAVTFTGPESKNQHMASERHKQKERLLLDREEKDFFCDLCKVPCSGPENLLQHQMGAQHRKMAGTMAEEAIGQNLPNFDRTQWFHCHVCNCSLNTYEQLKIHEQSPKHLKFLQRQHPSEVQINFSGDRTQWYPCHVCSCSMNTLEQLRTHEKSPKHLKQVEKQMSAGVGLAQDRTTWFPCNVCNCSLNSAEQLRAHEMSPAHISKLQNQGGNTHIGAYNSTSNHGKITDLNLSPGPKGDSVTPLQRFLSQELFPEEFLPKANDSGTENLIGDFEEKLKMTNEPFFIPPNGTQARARTDAHDQLELSEATGGTKRGPGSDLAYATRNRGTSENDGKTAHSPSHDRGDSIVQAEQSESSKTTAKTFSSKTDPTVNNPYKDTLPFYCHTCKVGMNTRETYESHVRGKRHMQKVSVEPAPLRTHHPPKMLPGDYLPFTQSKPRNYQIELYSKAMKENTLCFLPTGTGKTLVAVMTISAMLERCPSKNVLFLVDKVLLVLQQSKYIAKEIGNKEYDRYNPDSDTCMDVVRRMPDIAAVCMDQQTTHGKPLWKHDIVIVTAAFCKNLLDKSILRWEDFSLVVFDEAHHCEKGHPFNNLLTTYHRRTEAANKPKILGLTASPAGKADVPKTLLMLKGLVANMGDVRMTIVEDHENLDTLNEFQSNAEMIIRSHVDPTDAFEKKFRHELKVYITHCLMKLHKMSNIKHYVAFNGTGAIMTDDEIENMADSFIDENIDLIQSSLNMIENEDPNNVNKVMFSAFCEHVRFLCMALSCLEEGGVSVALQELDDMEETSGNFKVARDFGMPTANLHQILSKKGDFLGQTTTGDANGGVGEIHFSRLIDELTECHSKDKESDARRISLVLVKQRCTAHHVTGILQNSERMRRLGLMTTYVVGHGGSGAAAAGMKINQQKRVLEETKEYKYQVIVATSVAEEGVDWPDCERVISMYPPSTVTALVQMRGRARRKHSKFIVLCSSPEEEGKLYDIMKREENMIKATRILINENRQTDE